MAHYMQVSTQIYDIYLKYIAPEDIHVYSIDEVLIDVTGYLQTYRLSAYDLAMKMILDVVRTTGITATAGIGPNLYLAKVALDIGAKHIQPDENGVRIACLDEMSYRRTLWTHRPHPLDPPPADRFLAGGQRLCPQVGGPRDVHHGGYCPLLNRKTVRLLQ